MTNKPGQKKLCVKGGAPEHTHRLRNHHGPMVAQRCLGAKTNSLRMFALVSCFELPQRTSFWPLFWPDFIMSVRSSISFEVYRGLKEDNLKNVFNQKSALAIDFHRMEKILWKRMATVKCLVNYDWIVIFGWAVPLRGLLLTSFVWIYSW